MKKVVCFLLLFTLMLCVSSCATDEERIVGTWNAQETLLENVTTETQYIFNQDGTGRMRTVLGIEMRMEYSLDTENKVLTIVSSPLGIKITDEYTYELEYSTLTLTKGDKVIECTRTSEGDTKESAQEDALE